MEVRFEQLSKHRIKFYGFSTLLLLSSIVFTSFTHVAFSLWFCICGFIFINYTLHVDSLLPSLLLLFSKRKKGRRKSTDEFSLLKKVCPVCGANNCPRHRPELNILALQPWTNLMVPKKIDDALEELLNLVLNNYVYTWYRDLSDDEAFVDELKSCIRFITAVLLRRLKKIDVPDLILNKLVKASMRHIDCYLLAREIGGRADIQQSTLDTYGAHIHIAMRSRNTELEYLKRLVDRCLPHVTTPQSLRCRSVGSLFREIIAGSILLPVMDIIADPDIVNKLLLIFFDKTAPQVRLDAPSPDVILLHNFSLPLSISGSSLHLGSIADIMNNQEALYPFMQFLKNEASVHVLMFCLAADEFNKKILDPELTLQQKIYLHSELRQIYKMYLCAEAVDRIQFVDDIVEGIKSVHDGPPEEVVRLQTTTPLFRAYEHAYDLLETTFLPLFHQSDAYYIWLCGNRHSVRRAGASSNDALDMVVEGANVSKKRNMEQFGLSKIGNRLKDVFKTTTVDGRALEDGSEFDTAEDLVSPTADEGTGGGHVDGAKRERAPSTLRDLSSWRVTIPRVESIPEPETKRPYHVFVIEVRRLDTMNDTYWTVMRRYTEFYVLEQKLKEFHGDSLDARLPTKKTLGTKGAEFMESRRPVFEQYLQSLLTRPTLRGSEMVHNFLTSDNELTASFLPDINFGRMFKSVPMKLTKERGQHLETFLHSYQTSCDAPKPRPSRMDDGDSDTLSISSEHLANPMYENNANMDLSDPPPTGPSADDCSNVIDAVIYLAQNIWHAPNWFLRLLLTIRMVAMETVDDVIRWYMSKRLVYLTKDYRVESLIHLLKDVLFFDDDPPRTERQKLERREETLQALQLFLPGLLSKMLGQQTLRDGSAVFLELLQHPKLNKQLTYVFLDILIDDLFMEVTKQSTNEGRDIH